MPPASDLASYAALAAALGALLLKIDRWAHSPAALEKDIKDINDRFDTGNDRFSSKMSEVTTKTNQLNEHINAVDLRVTRLEALAERRGNERHR